MEFEFRAWRKIKKRFRVFDRDSNTDIFLESRVWSGQPPSIDEFPPSGLEGATRDRPHIQSGLPRSRNTANAGLTVKEK